MGGKVFRFMEPATNFNKMGLRFPLAYLNEAGTKVLSLSPDQLAMYADVITVKFVDDNDHRFIEALTRDLKAAPITKDDAKQLNATAFGNLTYVALNSKDKTLQMLCAERMLQIISLL